MMDKFVEPYNDLVCLLEDGKIHAEEFITTFLKEYTLNTKPMIVEIKYLDHYNEEWGPIGRATDGSVGYDLRNTGGDKIIHPGHSLTFATGVAMALPPGMEAQLRPRSGLATRNTLIIPNSPGTIDPDYRGEVYVVLANLGKDDVFIKRGERIAQIVFNRVELPEMCEVEELDDTKRGVGGYGSTGKL